MVIVIPFDPYFQELILRFFGYELSGFQFFNILFKSVFWSPTIFLTKESCNGFSAGLRKGDATLEMTISKEKGAFC